MPEFFTDFGSIAIKQIGRCLFIENEWPEKIAITKELIDQASDRYLRLEGLDVVFTLNNGDARYRKIDESANLFLCRCIEARKY